MSARFSMCVWQTYNPWNYTMNNHYGSVKLIPLTCTQASLLTYLEFTIQFTTANVSSRHALNTQKAWVESMFLQLGEHMDRARSIAPHVHIYTSSNGRTTTITTRHACLYHNVSLESLWHSYNPGRDRASSFSTHFRPTKTLLDNIPTALTKRVYHLPNAILDGYPFEMSEVEWGIDGTLPSFTTSMDFSKSTIATLRSVLEHLSIRSFHAVTFAPHTNISLSILLFTDSFTVPHHDISPITQFQNWFTSNIFTNLQREFTDGDDLTDNKAIRRSFSIQTAMRAPLLWTTINNDEEMTKIIGPHNVSLIFHQQPKVWRAYMPNQTDAFKAYETAIILSESQRENEDIQSFLTIQIQFQLNPNTDGEARTRVINFSHFFLAISLQQLMIDILKSVGQMLTYPTVDVAYPPKFLYRQLTNFTNSDWLLGSIGATVDDLGHSRNVALRNGITYKETLSYFNLQDLSFTVWVETPRAFEVDLYAGHYQITPLSSTESRLEYTSYYVDTDADQEKIKEILTNWANEQLNFIQKTFVASEEIKQQAIAEDQEGEKEL